MVSSVWAVPIALYALYSSVLILIDQFLISHSIPSIDSNYILARQLSSRCRWAGIWDQPHRLLLMLTSKCKTATSVQCEKRAMPCPWVQVSGCTVNIDTRFGQFSSQTRSRAVLKWCEWSLSCPLDTWPCRRYPENAWQHHIPELQRGRAVGATRRTSHSAALSNVLQASADMDANPASGEQACQRRGVPRLSKSIEFRRDTVETNCRLQQEALQLKGKFYRRGRTARNQLVLVFVSFMKHPLSKGDAKLVLHP